MAIAQTAGAAANSSTAVSSLALGSFTQTSGRTTVVCVSLSASSTVTSVTDTRSNTYTRKAQINGSGIRAEIWACTNISTGASVITANVSPASTIALAAEEYSGATALGNTGTASGSNYFAEARATAAEAGNWVVAAVAFSCQSGDTLTVFEGTSRQSSIPAATASGIGLIDNTAAGTCQLATGERISNSRNWAVASLELRSGGAALPYNNYTGALPLHVPPLLTLGGSPFGAPGSAWTFLS